MTRRRWVGAGIVLLLLTGAMLVLREPYPSDHTPAGAYLRIAESLTRQKPAGIFPYLETDAQWAAYSIRDARKELVRLVEEHYPPQEKPPLLAAHRPLAAAPDGADVVSVLGEERGWFKRLRKDLSGVATTEISSERATVVTSHGSRYPFRLRENGIWGLTLFTSELLREKERAARDLLVVRQAASDYARAAGKSL